MAEKFQDSSEGEQKVLKEISLTEAELDILFDADPEDEGLEETLSAYGLHFGDSVLIHVEGRHDAVYTLRKDDFMTRDMRTSFAHQKKSPSFVNKIFGRRSVQVEDDGTSLSAEKLDEILGERAHSAEGEPIDLDVSDEMGEIAIEQVTDGFEEFTKPEKKTVKVEVAEEETEATVKVAQEAVSTENVEVAPVEEVYTEEEVPVEGETRSSAEQDEMLERYERHYQEQILSIKHELNVKLAETSELLSSNGNMSEVFANLLRNATDLMDDTKMLRAFEGDPDKFRKESGRIIDDLYKAANNLENFATNTVEDVTRGTTSLERSIQQQHDDAEKVDRDYTSVVHEQRQLREIEPFYAAATMVEAVEKKLSAVTYDVPSQLKSASIKAENAASKLRQFAKTIQGVLESSKQTPDDRINNEDLQYLVTAASEIESTYGPIGNSANEKHLHDIESALDKAIAVIAEARN